MPNKLGEAILYIAQQSKEDKSFGATKLNKILFLVDFYAYGIWGKPITDATYKKLERGPVPHELPIAKDTIIKQNRAKEEEVEYFGKIQKRIIPIDKPDLSVFSEEEIELLSRVIIECGNFNATELSEYTHTLLPWLDAEEGEEIPFETVFMLKEIPVSFEDIKWGEKIVEEISNTGNA